VLLVPHGSKTLKIARSHKLTESKYHPRPSSYLLMIDLSNGYRLRRNKNYLLFAPHLFWGSSESFVSRIILYSPTMVYETCNRLKNDFSVHHCKPLFTLLLGHLDLLLCSFTSLTSSNLITQFKGCCLSDLTVLLLSILQKPTAFINSSVRIYYLT